MKNMKVRVPVPNLRHSRIKKYHKDAIDRSRREGRTFTRVDTDALAELLEIAEGKA